MSHPPPRFINPKNNKTTPLYVDSDFIGKMCLSRCGNTHKCKYDTKPKHAKGKLATNTSILISAIVFFVNQNMYIAECFCLLRSKKMLISNITYHNNPL